MMLHKAQISGDGLLSQVGKILSGDGVIEVKSIWFKEDLSIKKRVMAIGTFVKPKVGAMLRWLP